MKPEDVSEGPRLMFLRGLQASMTPDTFRHRRTTDLRVDGPLRRPFGRAKFTTALIRNSYMRLTSELS